MEEKLFTGEELAARWQVHPNTIKNWARARLVTAVKRGNTVRYLDRPADAHSEREAAASAFELQSA